MPKILIINGPNLNNLGKRDSGHYGSITLDQVNAAIAKRASELGIEVSFFQSNHEGAIVDHIQASAGGASGVIINGGALTQVGYSILDALLDSRLPVVEVHLSNIHAREEFRRHSVIAPYAIGQIAGLGWRGYIYALEFLAARIADEKK
ncbi:MAG: type II 3-dehydroquinate dehydratase [Chloroflexi bacterium]|nr:type II 3-dehydroquinate dehydratase [Chloroflexota bacterium]MDA1297419.1 type II 3-dehydroquinate dehydratase [Chloroflexota bacterium]